MSYHISLVYVLARLHRVAAEADKVIEAVDVPAVRAHVGCRVDLLCELCM